MDAPLLLYQRMFDIIMIFEYLHHQFGCFNRNIQTACFHKFMGFKNRLTRSCTAKRTVSAQYKPDSNNSLLRSTTIGLSIDFWDTASHGTKTKNAEFDNYSLNE